MHLLTALLCAVLLLLPAAADAEFWATPVPFAPDQKPGARIGPLVFKGALQLTAADKSFGGLSGLDVSAMPRVSAVSDRGYFVAFDLVEDEDGTLTGATSLRIERMMDAAGRPLPPADRDAEDLVVLPDGRRVVVFERNARLGLFAPGSARQERAASLLDLVPGGNEGVEALVAFPDGRLLMIAERLGHWDVTRRAWVGAPGRWEPLEYLPHYNDDVVSAALLPDGDLLVLQRSATVLGGFQARLVRVRGRDLRPGARLAGEILLELAPPGLSDNFEGVAVRPLGNGRAAIYLVSDDNYFTLQRTYLAKFELAAP